MAHVKRGVTKRARHRKILKMTNQYRSMLCLLAVLSIVVYIADAAFFQPVEELILASCKDYGILAGDTMDADCTRYCSPNATETFDYADSDEDPEYVVRNSVCRCFSSEAQFEGESDEPQSNGMTFECWTKAEVWEKAIPILKCGEKYNITSITTCQAFCMDIDPLAYAFAGNAGSAQCTCAGIEVCNDITATG